MSRAAVAQVSFTRGSSIRCHFWRWWLKYSFAQVAQILVSTWLRFSLTFTSYILPLFAFDFTVWSEVVLFLVFFFVFAFLSIRHSHFSVNILLELMNYRFYSCELKNEDGISISKTVICQKILSARIGETILVRPINNEYAVKLNEENFDTHEYQETISSKDNVAFTSEVEHLKERYQLP